ncbi:hypothetical protein F5Y16DRAFT_422385 [Xylariaceae sp. FL0255]|nr:hypothetical protein F5Y16DRAFT_422385 [Xylariaceae sp. FL0255]
MAPSGSNIALPNKLYCKQCAHKQPAAEFSQTQIRKWRSAGNKQTVQLTCKAHANNQVRELRCSGPCGRTKNTDKFSKAQRVTSEPWCTACSEWKESSSGQGILAPPPQELDSMRENHRARESFATKPEDSESEDSSSSDSDDSGIGRGSGRPLISAPGRVLNDDENDHDHALRIAENSLARLDLGPQPGGATLPSDHVTSSISQANTGPTSSTTAYSSFGRMRTMAGRSGLSATGNPLPRGSDPFVSAQSQASRIPSTGNPLLSGGNTHPSVTQSAGATSVQGQASVRIQTEQKKNTSTASDAKKSKGPWFKAKETKTTFKDAAPYGAITQGRFAAHDSGSDSESPDEW